MKNEKLVNNIKIINIQTSNLVWDMTRRSRCDAARTQSLGKLLTRGDDRIRPNHVFGAETFVLIDAVRPRIGSDEIVNILLRLFRVNLGR